MEYTITNVQRRDEWRSKYATGDGNDMVNFAIALQGQDGWVKLNQKVTTPPPAVGSTLSGYIEDKGTYKQFKKVNPQFGNQGRQPDSPVQNDKLDYIVKMLEELTGRRETEEVPQDRGDQPVNLMEDDPFAGFGV